MLQVISEKSFKISESNNAALSDKQKETFEIKNCLQKKEEENRNCLTNENGSEKVSLIEIVKPNTDVKTDDKKIYPLHEENLINSTAISQKDKKMAYDDVILHMGEFGRYQRRIYLLLCLPAISCAFHKMSGVFLGAKPNFRCLLPNENPYNSTLTLDSDLMNSSFPWDTATNNWSNCERYDVSFEDASYTSSVKNLSSSSSSSSSRPKTVKCESFVYDKSNYQLTTTTQVSKE